jgi:membrane fusion protein, multidrug efflux system
LLKSNSISKAEFDLAQANQTAALGQIANLEATLERAALDLSFTRVTSPITGLLSRALVTKGNLVVADTTILTSVVSTDPIYAYFDVDESSVLDYRQRIRQGTVTSARDAKIPIRLALANESDFPHEGVIDFVENITDPNTGNTRIRGRFPNPQRALSSGLYARIKVPFTAPYQALTIPTQAIAMDQQGRYLLVVDATGKVQRRGIKAGTQHGERTVIASGIDATDRVIVSGLQKVTPGASVTVRP